MQQSPKPPKENCLLLQVYVTSLLFFRFCALSANFDVIVVVYLLEQCLQSSHSNDINVPQQGQHRSLGRTLPKLKSKALRLLHCKWHRGDSQDNSHLSEIFKWEWTSHICKSSELDPIFQTLKLGQRSPTNLQFAGVTASRSKFMFSCKLWKAQGWLTCRIEPERCKNQRICSVGNCHYVDIDWSYSVIMGFPYKAMSKTVDRVQWLLKMQPQFTCNFLVAVTDWFKRSPSLGWN